MSFYNPNIQAAFDADTVNYICLKNRDIVRYKMIFKIKDGCTVNDKECIQSPYQLEFICFHNANLFDNLTLITPEFPSFLAEIALEVLAGRVDTFESFLLQKIALTGESKRNEILYLGDQIQDFIEMLIYSDISNNYRSDGKRDFTKIFGCRDDEDKPRFYTLYERLKLYARLRKEIKLVVDRNSITLNQRLVTLDLNLRIE